jgi:hypothetical protein
MAGPDPQNPTAGAPKPTIGDLSIPGMGIYPGDEDQPWPLVIRSSTPREDWKVFHPLSDPEHERGGTTLLYKDQAYLIDQAGVTRAGVWTYRLKPWPVGEAWHRVVRLTPEDMAREAAEKQAFEKARQLEEISIYYEFLLGFLPARVQIKLAEHMRFSPTDASRKNAFLQFIGGMGLCVLMTAAVVGAGMGGGGAALGAWLLSVVFACLMGEGFLRWGHIHATHEPLGLYLLEVCDRLYLRLRR